MYQSCVDILEASPADLKRLYALIAKLLQFDTFSIELLNQKLFFNPHPDRDEYHTLIAEMKNEAVGMLQHVIRAGEGRAWLGLFAVVTEHQRHNIGQRLYKVALEKWQKKNIQVVDLLTIPTNYLVPGIDPRYTAGVCFLESLGFLQRAQKINMRAQLDGDFSTTKQEAILNDQGIEIRRAQVGDETLIERFFVHYFGEGWLAEARIAISRQPPSMHLALNDEKIIGFAAHSTMNQEWGNFGPVGIADEFRNRHIGHVLLYRCMDDLKKAGFPSAVIPWTESYHYYCKLLNCAIERIFWQYRLKL
ncbi:MAG: GNAT family N-acetyltransferase [Planctomycetota bacterium]|jgi:N-acetylglutamate synthase-like GNAT family acetyltransferase